MIRLDACTLPLAGRCLIEASAGTGKTWTITSIVLRLLLGHAGSDASPVPPRRVQDILIVTFTKAATEELRGRIRKRLRAAREAFETGVAPDNDAVIATLLAASNDRAEDTRRLRLAEMELDLASIFTIHGFASRMLNRNAFESRISFAAQLSENDAAVVTEAIRDIWRERVYPLPPLPAALLLAAGDSEIFVATVRRLLGKQGLELRNVPAQDWDAMLADIAAAESGLLAWWRANAAMAREALAGTALNKGGRSALARALPRLDAAAAGDALLDRATLDGVARTSLARELTKKKGNALPELELLDLADALLAAGDALWPRLLADALEAARSRLAAIKERTGLLGYEDLLRLLDEGLRAPGGERLAAAIRTQYPVALIDEFQDTDPLQWAVFSTIYAGEDTALFLVGDPKQAIYAFRGADVQAYLQVRREAAGIWSLDTNYRSVEPLVAALNALFTLRGDGDPFLAGSDMPFHAVLPSGAPDQAPLRRDGETVTPLAVLHLASAAPISGGAYRARIAAAAANHLAELLTAADAGRRTAGREEARARRRRLPGARLAGREEDRDRARPARHPARVPQPRQRVCQPPGGGPLPAAGRGAGARLGTAAARRAGPRAARAHGRGARCAARRRGGLRTRAGALHRFRRRAAAVRSADHAAPPAVRLRGTGTAARDARRRARADRLPAPGRAAAGRAREPRLRRGAAGAPRGAHRRRRRRAGGPAAAPRE